MLMFPCRWRLQVGTVNPETVQGLGVLASLSWRPEALLHFKFEKN